MFRAAILAASLVMAVSGTAIAGDPPTLGAYLGATRSEVVIDSTASVETTVRLTAPNGWELAETTFEIAPGGHHVVQIVKAGPDAGQIVLTQQAVEVPGGVDRSALVLALGTPQEPPASPPWWVILAVLVVLSLLVAAFIVPRRRVHR